MVDSPSHGEALNWLIQMAMLMELGSTFHYNSCTSDILASYYRMIDVSYFHFSTAFLNSSTANACPCATLLCFGGFIPAIPLNVFDSAVPPFLKPKPQSLG